MRRTDYGFSDDLDDVGSLRHISEILPEVLRNIERAYLLRIYREKQEMALEDGE